MATFQRQIRDASWVRQSFLVAGADLEPTERRNRYFTTARFKFTDTTPGGNVAINPPPQFTRNADIKVHGIFSPLARNNEIAPHLGTKGQGRAYSEMIDDNNRIVTMRFGVPQYNSLTRFWTGFYSGEASRLANTGRGGGVFYNIGRVVGFIVPIIALPLYVFNLAGNIWRWLDMKPASKYYYLKPTMPLYWNAVTTIVNQIAVNKAIVPRVGEKTGTRALDERYQFTEADMQRFSDLLPDIQMEGGGINVYAMATKAQRLARLMYKNISKRLESADRNTNVSAIIDDIYQNGLKTERGKSSDPSYWKYLQRWFETTVSQTGEPVATPSASNNTSSGTTEPVSGGIEAIPADKPGVWNNFKDFMEAELDDGSAFVSFRVNAEGSVSESFSNQVGESSVASKFNSMSGESRSTRFSFGDGNIGGGSAGAILGGIASAAKDFAAGIADGLEIAGIAAMGGSAFVDIPQHWQSSVANLPSMSYSFSLTSPYGNKLSQLFNLYVPLAMILAAALPRSTGKQSYTSPFILELYDRGRAQTRLGIIDSLTITRGTSNLPFNNTGEVMAIDVSFTVKDLSTVMHMPIVSGFSLTNLTGSMFDDDNTFSDYMATLGSLSLHEQIYTSDRLRLALTRQAQSMKTWFSTAHFANFIGDLAPARILSLWYAGNINR